MTSYDISVVVKRWTSDGALHQRNIMVSELTVKTEQIHQETIPMIITLIGSLRSRNRNWSSSSHTILWWLGLMDKYESLDNINTSEILTMMLATATRGQFHPLVERGPSVPVGKGYRSLESNRDWWWETKWGLLVSSEGTGTKGVL
jgi:hypothetical protein